MQILDGLCPSEKNAASSKRERQGDERQNEDVSTALAWQTSKWGDEGDVHWKQLTPGFDQEVHRSGLRNVETPTGAH